MPLTNDIPQQLLDLAREAIAAGLGAVSIGFYYLDDDFVSPIEWALHLTKREHLDDTDVTWVTVTASREETAPRAYVSDRGYWGVEQIRAWFQEPLSAIGDYVPAWAPVTDPRAQEHLLANWDLLELGARHGWSVTHKTDWIGKHSLDRVLEREPNAHLPGISMEWSASNGFYNKKGHPAHRKSGAPVSVNGFSCTSAAGAQSAYMHGRYTDRPHQLPLTPEQLREILGRTAPWFVRVAGVDQNDEAWQHFPERKAWKKSDAGMQAAVADTEYALSLIALPEVSAG